MSTYTIGFICVHNSCRSQMAEAIAKLQHSDLFVPYSAGTETKDRINQDAVRIIKERFFIDMEKTQSSKLIAALPPLDIVVTMGCNVDCPWLPSKYRTDFGLDDPSGMSDEFFHKTIDIIIEKLHELRKDIEEKKIPSLQN